MRMPVVVGAKVGSDGVCHQYTCTHEMQDDCE
jgi:hypothetical protein